MQQQNLADFIWNVADALRGPFKPSLYGRITLPFTVLRRPECVLEPTRDAVLAQHQGLATTAWTWTWCCPTSPARVDRQASGGRSRMDFAPVPVLLWQLDDQLARVSRLAPEPMSSPGSWGLVSLPVNSRRGQEQDP